MWLVLCLTFNNSAKSLSSSTFWGCFGILRTSRIQNCHWNLILSKNSLRKTGKRPRQVKVDRLYIWHVVLSVRSRLLPTRTIIMWYSEFLLADSRAHPSLEDNTSLGLDSMKKILFSPTVVSSMSSSSIFVLHNVSISPKQPCPSLLSSTLSSGHVSSVSNDNLDSMPRFLT